MTDTNHIKQRIEFVPFSAQYAEPKFEVRRGKSWVEFGSDNLLPKYVESLIDMSPDVAAVINGTIAFAIGSGLVPPTETNALALFQNGEQNLAEPNDLGKIQERLIRDLVVYGACLVNVRWRKDRSGIADVHYVDVASMRIDVDGEGFWISSDWSNPRKFVPVFFPKFNTRDGGSQLLYVRLPSARSTPYAMPSYWSARQSIQLQNEIARFNLSRVKNNFFASVVITYDDIPNSEEQDANHKALKNFFTGPEGENVGGAIQLYGGGVKIDKFEAAVTPQDYFLLMEQADQRIRSAFRVTGRGDLFGLGRGDGATFSSADDLLNEFETYSKIVVRPIQNCVLAVWQLIAQVNNVKHQFEIDPFILFERDDVKTAQKEKGKKEEDNTDLTDIPDDSEAARAA